MVKSGIIGLNSSDSGQRNYRAVVTKAMDIQLLYSLLNGQNNQGGSGRPFIYSINTAHFLVSKGTITVFSMTFTLDPIPRQINYVSKNQRNFIIPLFFNFYFSTVHFENSLNISRQQMHQFYMVYQSKIIYIKTL